MTMLLTLHRAENVDERRRLELLVESFLKLSQKIKNYSTNSPENKKKSN